MTMKLVLVVMVAFVAGGAFVFFPMREGMREGIDEMVASGKITINK